MKTTDLVDQLVERLAEIRGRRPELRLGQIMATIGMLAEDDTGHSLWEIDDAQLIAAADRFAADLERS
jgi:hypothetical protein